MQQQRVAVERTHQEGVLTKKDTTKTSKVSVIDVIPFRLHNIQDFIVNHPEELHPDLPEYKEHWLEQAENCIIGKWGYDYDEETGLGGWRWMPGNLYFYINMGIIKQTGAQNTVKEERPKLRSTDWMMGYALTACDGFSGMSDDEEFCCFEPIEKIQNGEELSETLKVFLDDYGDLYKKPNGEWKTYIEAREYLYKTKDTPKGSPYYHNEAKNLLLISSRRIGKSYFICVGISVYDLVFNGARSLEDWVNQSTTTTSVLGSDDYKTTGEFLDKFDLTYGHLKKKVGAFDTGNPETSVNGYFWLPLNEKGEDLGKVYREKGGVVTNGKYGPGSRMIHVSYGKNHQAGVGYGARRMIIEEAAKVPHFEDVHRENSATQKADFKYGYSVYIATGGDIDLIKEIKEAYNDPKKYNCLAYPDLWGNSDKGIGLFFPCPYRNTRFYDKNGNLDLERAYRKEVQEREELKGGKGYAGHCISFPFRPSEMFVQNSGSKFSVEELTIRLQELEEGEWKANAKVGKLHYTDKENRKVFFEHDKYGKLSPIMRHGDEKKLKDLTGAFVMYEEPKYYRPDRYSNNPLYIAIYDTVAKDKEVSGESAGSSLSCVLVFKLNDMNSATLSYNLVAEWFGRYDELDENHRMAWMIADFYDCKLFCEANLDDIFRYSKKNGRWNDLQNKPSDTPSEIAKGGSYTKGYMITPQNKPKLLEYAYQSLEIVVDRKDFIIGNDYYSEIQKVVNKIPSIRLCDEFLSYNDDENFDGVSCWLLWSLYRRNKDAEPVSSESNEMEDANINDFNSLTNQTGTLVNPVYNW